MRELYRLGGVTKRETLVARTSRRAVDRALRRADILRDSRGRYAVAVAGEAIRAALARRWPGAGAARYRRVAASADWVVLRFAGEDVMHDPAYVRRCLQRAVLRHAQPARLRRRAA